MDQKLLINNEYVRVQLFPEMERCFYLEMNEIGFPIYLHMKNVSNSGFLYVGYNREFPGI